MQQANYQSHRKKVRSCTKALLLSDIPVINQAAPEEKGKKERKIEKTEARRLVARKGA